MTRPIYLDYNATTPIDARVASAMLPFVHEEYGNASSAHAYGWTAREAVDLARSRVAELLGARAGEIIFTGSGSETNNLAIKGVAFAAHGRPVHVVTTAVEHPAVLNTLAYLHQRFGVTYTVARVDASGRVTAAAIEEALRPDTVLITVMHANNETGAVQPVADISQVARRAGVLLHVDAAQSAGKLPLNVDDLGVDLLSLAGHKLYGPKGTGALYCRRSVALDPLIHGSSQEGGLRAGTENVPGIVGLGMAALLASHDVHHKGPCLTELRDSLEGALRRGIPELLLNGDRDHRLPNTLNVSFPRTTGQMVLLSTPEIAASTGSACHSAVPEPSPVLLAMGLSRERALGAVRLSLGRMTTLDEVNRAASALLAGYRSLVPDSSP